MAKTMQQNPPIEIFKELEITNLTPLYIIYIEYDDRADDIPIAYFLEENLAKKYKSLAEAQASIKLFIDKQYIWSSVR